MASPASAPTTPPSYLGTPPADDQWRPTRRTWLVLGAILAAIVLLIAIVAVIAELRDDDTGGTGRHHVVTAPLGGRAAATLELLSGVTSTTVRMTDLGDRLVRAATPDGSDLIPTVTVTGDRVQVQLAKRGPAGPDAIEVQLNSRVRWAVRALGGGVEQVVDAGAGRLAGIDVVAGVTRIETTLPRPQGTVVVRMSGGANQFLLHAPDGVPVRVRIGGGAATAVLDGNARSGISAGTVITPPGWDGATDRYDVDAAAGVSAVIVDRS
jgi:hypothetical protein